MATLITEANNQERAAGTVGVSDEALLKTWLACKSIDNRQFCVEFGRAVLTLVDHSSAMEKIAQQWDGCFCEIASVGQVDIGAAIRSDWEQYNHLAATSTKPADEVIDVEALAEELSNLGCDAGEASWPYLQKPERSAWLEVARHVIKRFGRS